MRDEFQAEGDESKRVLLLIDTQSADGRGIALGVQAVARARGWDFRVAWCSNHPLVENIEYFRPHAVAVGPGMHRQLPAEFPIDVVVAANFDPALVGHAKWPAVLIDDEQVARQAAEHLLARGLHHFATFGIGPGSAEARMRAFSKAISDGGGLHDDSLFVNSSSLADGPTTTFSQEITAHLVQRLMELPKPAGILACCDTSGEMLNLACRFANLRVPEEVAILAVGNDEVNCALVNPPLSSIAIPWNQVGIETGELIHRLLQGQPKPSAPLRVAPTGVIVRQSTDMLAIEDREVASALKFIHDHADQPITVSDVVAHVGTYRHRLQRGFQQLVGRHMRDELRRVHVERAKRLLALTTMSIPEVATGSGFANATKLGQGFRIVTGQTPTQFRNTFQMLREM